MRRLWALGFLCFPALAVAASDLAAVPGGPFRSVLPESPTLAVVSVKPYRMDRRLVSNDEFAAFVKRQPQWRRGAAPAIFADGQYLAHWGSPDAPGPGNRKQAVTHVSWFAASAYCEARGARLPTWYEWEFAAAADATRADARDDPAWRQQILDWYARPSVGGLPNAGASKANYFGIRDLHGVAWEWVDDFAALMVSGDNREQGDPDLLKFCGAGALSMEQKDNYAVLMRVAMLSSLKASYTTANLGFRCAQDGPP